MFSNLNLNSLRFKTSEMFTRWISDKDFKWTYLVEGLDENGQAEQVPVTPTNFGKFGISNLCLRTDILNGAAPNYLSEQLRAPWRR